MKIVISPSKTADYQLHPALTSSEIPYPKATKKLLSSIRKFNKEALGKALTIKGNILDQTYKEYKDYHKSPSYHAFASFNGLVFKQLDKSSYTESSYRYIESHLRILDALYGYTKPGTRIKPYRLDMKAKLGFSLYQFWQINEAFSDSLIINLASKEFAQMLDMPMVTVEFYERQNGKLKSLATYSKMARGKLLNYIILNEITTIEEIAQFREQNYQYDKSLSTTDTIVFTR